VILLLKKTVIIIILILFSQIHVYAEENRNIEIFDISQGKVIKMLKLDSKIENIAISYLKGIRGLYGKFNPIPNKGYAIAIPLQPPVKIHDKWLNALVNEVIIMFPEHEPPFIVVIDDENRLVCFYFRGNTDILLKDLDFKLN
jgi:hypothetical protein